MSGGSGSAAGFPADDGPIRFTDIDIRYLRGLSSDDIACKRLERKTRGILKFVREINDGRDWFGKFEWEGEKGSPHINSGTTNKDGSRHVWLSLAHERYQAVGGRTKGLQLEFGLDGGEKRGFFGRDVLCGVYLGPWATDPVLAEVSERLQSRATDIASHLDRHEDDVLHIGDRMLREPSPETVRETATDISEGLLLTTDLSLADVRACPAIDRLVATTFARLLPLYGLLAGDDSLAKADVETGSNIDGGSADAADPTPGSDDQTTGGDNSSIEPTVESIVANSNFDEEQVSQKLETLEKRGSTRSEALRIVRQYVVDMERGAGLYSLHGLGPVTGYALERAGITSIEALARTPIDELESIDGLSASRARTVHEAATERIANRETEGTTAGDDPKEERNSPSDPADSTDADAPSTDADPPVVTVGDERVVANALSEYYEAFRCQRKVLETFIRSPDSPHRPDDLTDPLIQYFVLLDACIAYGTPDMEFVGYGPQQQHRLSFSIDAYRDAFGNGSWITDYQVIDVEPYRDETLEWLRERLMLKNPEKFVRPVPPEGDCPLFESVTSMEELEAALAVLDRFPAYPEIPTDPGASDRTIPVAALYERLFAELDDEHTLNAIAFGTAPGSITGPVAEATPGSTEEIDSFLRNHQKLTHLFGRIDPPTDSPVRRQVSVFALDWYRAPGLFFQQLRRLAQDGATEPVEYFLPRIRDLINRRFLRDHWNYDLIAVFPSHRADTLSEPLVSLAREAVLETPIIYAPLLERTETVERQREKSREERLETARNPDETLRCRSKLDGDTVLLLDDVSTTGSSLLAGAHVLHQAGARRVLSVTLGLRPGEAIETRKITSLDGRASEVISGVEK